MSRSDLCRDFDMNVYNGLMSVDGANKTARDGGQLDEFLDSASKLFFLHGMHTRFGVALLHNHNLCEDGERMIQYACTINQENALVTRPVKTQAGLNSEVPSIWALLDHKFRPLEFTTDQKACELFFADDVPDAFLNDYISLAESSPVGYLVGLAIVERAFYETAHAGDVVIEYQNPVERSNVLFVRSRDHIPQSIETTWKFQGYTDTASGEVFAATECVSTCKAITQCVVWCKYEDGKHSDIHGEATSHQEHHIQRPD